MQTSRVAAAEPTFDAFIDWSQHLRWDTLPGTTRAMLKRELLDYLGVTLASTATVHRHP